MFDVENQHIYFVGIKGTGMCALAEVCRSRGAVVSGSDIADTFYTDTILDSLGVTVFEGFSPSNLPDRIDTAFYSLAYDRSTHPELVELDKRGIPLYSYPEGLGALGEGMISCGVAGVHGKTSTTAIMGTLVKALDIPAQVVAGSSIANFDGCCTYNGGDSYFIAETCEYRRSFLNFHPSVILITSVELDHPDYFPDFNAIQKAFLDYIDLLPVNGTVVYCADDAGAKDSVEKAVSKRSDLRTVPYGKEADGPFRIENEEMLPGEQRFSLSGIEFSLRLPGAHMILNSAGAIAALSVLTAPQTNEAELSLPNLFPAEKLKRALFSFRSTRRRSEILGELDGVLYIDDYGHHPTAIASTLKGFREFYPRRRLVVDFMPHTFTRTEVLFDHFIECFADADILILNKIYGSAREKRGEIRDDSLYRALKDRQDVYYCPELSDGIGKAREILRPGDVFITMGAGDNWKIARTLLKDAES